MSGRCGAVEAPSAAPPGRRAGLGDGEGRDELLRLRAVRGLEEPAVLRRVEEVVRQHRIDFDSASDLLGYLDRLETIDETEGCTALPPNLPSVKHLPSLSGLPNLPRLPSLPSLPSPPTLPSLASLPDLASLLPRPRDLRAQLVQLDEPYSDIHSL